MLIASLRPLLSRYSLGFDLVSGPDGTVTLTIIPRRPEGGKQNLEVGELRPIALTASAEEIDAELAKGVDGALGQLIATRKTLADQLAEQRGAADAARATSAAAAKTAPPPAKTGTPASTSPTKTPSPTTPPADARAEEPASLW